MVPLPLANHSESLNERSAGSGNAESGMMRRSRDGVLNRVDLQVRILSF